MLFEGEYLASAFPATGVTYDVTPDGQRFLMVKDDQTTSGTQIKRRRELVRGAEAPRADAVAALTSARRGPGAEIGSAARRVCT